MIRARKVSELNPIWDPYTSNANLRVLYSSIWGCANTPAL